MRSDSPSSIEDVERAISECISRRPKLVETVHQEVLTFETEDIVGRLVMESSLGQLTVFEMELVSWIMAKWVQKEVPESPTVEFFEAELAREFGVQWGGSRAKFQKEALRKAIHIRQPPGNIDRLPA